MGKGRFFGDVLGFSKDTLGTALKSHLLDNLGSAVADGTRVTVEATMTGANGRTANVVSVWQLVDGAYQLITAVPGKK